MEGCNFDLPPDSQIPHRIRSRRSTWRPSSYTRVLHRNVVDGRSSTDHEHRRIADGGGARWRTWKDTSRQLQTRSNDQDRYPRQSINPSSTHDLPQRELGCLCQEPWQHAQGQPFSHSAQVESVTHFSTYPSEEASVRPRTGLGYSKRSPQVARGRLHQRSLLSQLASECGDGQENQLEVEDVRRLYGPEQSIP